MRATMIVLADKQPPTFTWDATVARYRNNQTGRFVSEKTVLAVVESYAKNVAAQIETHTQKFIEGKTTLQQWQQAMAKEVKNAWLVQTMAGRGGAQAMTFSEYGRLGARLRFQYARLNEFALAIKEGNLTPQQILYRARLYANSTRTGYYDGMTAAKRAAGYVAEARFLRPGESCEDCIAYAARGKVPLGTLPEPGQQSACNVNCNCVKEYYRAEEIL